MYTEELAEMGRKGFRTLWDVSVADPNDRKTLEAINGIQRGLQCCGSTGPRDWESRPVSFPTSCCQDGTNSCNAGNAFQNGCETVLGDIVKGSGLLIAWIAIVFAGFEVTIRFITLTKRNLNILFTAFGSYLCLLSRKFHPKLFKKTIRLEN